MRLPVTISLVSALFTIFNAPALAGQTTFGDANDAAMVTYDTDVWTAKELANLPYFECAPDDCGSASCLVIVSANPSFVKWPETINSASLAALDEIFVNNEKQGGLDKAKVLEPMHPITFGKHDTLSMTIGIEDLSTGWVATRHLMNEAGNTRIVTCEGDAPAMAAYKEQIGKLIEGIVFNPQ
jgi:hypothetical protein